jgi:hypothetical protein
MDTSSIFDWKSLTLSAVIGYVISWAYFFLALPAFQATFGKIKGAAIDYATSWVVWLGAGYVIHIQ